MTFFKVLNNKEKQVFVDKLNEQFGISKIVGSLITFGHDKFRVFTGDITAERITTLKQFFRLEILGSYFFTAEDNGDVRLSHDASIILREQITKNFVVISKEQEVDWLRGKDVSLNEKQVIDYESIRGFVVVKSENGVDVVGCGRVGADGRLRNFVPKERRIKG